MALLVSRHWAWRRASISRAHLAVSLSQTVYEAQNGTHKHAKVGAWLASHPRSQIHYTLTYASWLNQVEPLVRPCKPNGAIRRSSFRKRP